MIKNNQNNKVNPIPYFLICLITSILLDLLLTNHILHDIFISTTKSNIIDITYVQNTGAAFSSFQALPHGIPFRSYKAVPVHWQMPVHPAAVS